MKINLKETTFAVYFCDYLHFSATCSDHSFPADSRGDSTVRSKNRATVTNLNNV